MYLVYYRNKLIWSIDKIINEDPLETSNIYYKNHWRSLGEGDFSQSVSLNEYISMFNRSKGLDNVKLFTNIDDIKVEML